MQWMLTHLNKHCIYLHPTPVMHVLVHLLTMSSIICKFPRHTHKSEMQNYRLTTLCLLGKLVISNHSSTTILSHNQLNVLAKDANICA